MLAHRLRERLYTSVQDFSRDMSLEIGKVLAKYNDDADTEDVDIDAIHNQLNEIKPGTAEHHALSQEQKEIKKLAKRLVKAVKELLEDALKKEAELKGCEHEAALRKLDSMGIFASTRSIERDDVGETRVASKRRSGSDVSAVAGADAVVDDDMEMHDADQHTDEAVIHLSLAGKAGAISIPRKNHTPTLHESSCALGNDNRTVKGVSAIEPLSPPISTNSAAANAAASAADANDVFAQGGVPWYLEPFDPEGTTVHDERYTGRAVLRDMSEELSDMDEDTLTELAINSVEATPMATGTPAQPGGDTNPVAKIKKAASAKKKARSRRFR